MIPIDSNLTLQPAGCSDHEKCVTTSPHALLLSLNSLRNIKIVVMKNILLACWHANSKFYSPLPWAEREHDLLFIGSMNKGRDYFFNTAAERGVELAAARGMTNEEMFELHSNVKIGINMSINFNDPKARSQMKQRVLKLLPAAV